MNTESSKSIPRAVCRQCRYYYITWDPRRPYGCKALGFKSVKIPSQVVYESSGLECQSFQPKPKS
ncbi:MAG TPA: uracil-DNA glycosylase [bacterium]|nr:uracil-DNA glycosylase [bacterium]HOL93595.1 uracil-DNA glycosylase [bacterium]HPO99562.1 uracil-DNA glycosylase [bacterium]